ncbi:MAG: hypothetical protein FJ218_03830 [Ignavibacteria bacterium]|nr:hypothetical protein [Ignavibacteria bacterium]
MSSQELQQIKNGWQTVSPFVFVPHNEEEYNRIVDLLDNLIDEVGEDEFHPLTPLMELLGTLIEKYEAENVPELV